MCNYNVGNMFNKEKFVRDCQSIRTQSPLIHNITNYVAMDFSANALLAIGASPLMSFCPEEMEEIVKNANALVVNIGCLDLQQIEAMKIAVSSAKKYGKQWILDPVGIGVSELRMCVCDELISIFAPTVIRGNASEILTLTKQKISSHGVDSLEKSKNVIATAQDFSRKLGSVISVSGEIDYIIDADNIAMIGNGHYLMSKVTAMGCTASALTGAFLAIDSDAFVASQNAMALMGVAGEEAMKKSSGTGSLRLHFLDELTSFSAETYSKLVRYE